METEINFGMNIPTREITIDELRQNLEKLTSPTTEVRENGEKFLNDEKFNINLYKAFVTLSFNDSPEISIQLKIQCILTMKNIIRQELNNRKRNFDFTGAQEENVKKETLEDIITFLKSQILSFMYTAKFFNELFMNQFNDLVLVIADKYFPDKWDELQQFYFSFTKLNVEPGNLFNDQFYSVSGPVARLFFEVLKQYSSKRTPMTKTKFYPYKKDYLESFVPYYEKIVKMFYDNMNNFTDMGLSTKCLNLLMSNDLILLMLIDISYNQSEFQKDEALLYMLDKILDKAAFLIEQIIKTQIKELNTLLQNNLYKILKYLAVIQYANPIIFYRCMDRYTKILFTLIENTQLFSQEISKATLFGLFKILTTNTYKDYSTDSKDSNLNYISSDDSCINKTPEKRKTPNPYVCLTSPAKYKNFERELKICIETYNQIFSEENVFNLLDNLISKIPYVFKKETETGEIEVLSEFEDEHGDRLEYSTYSPALITYSALYKTVIENVIINFNAQSTKYIKSMVLKLYKDDPYQQHNCCNISPNENSISKLPNALKPINYLLLDSMINFINVMPYLYKQKYISITDMIDANEFISFVEKFADKSIIMLKRYIISLSKWSIILISNETIFEYINKLFMLISNIKDTYVLVECFLCINSILDTLDKKMNSNNDSINTAINKETYMDKMKTSVNWSNLLCSTTNILEQMLPKIESTELIMALVKFFTTLVEKCLYQSGGEIINIFSQSKLFEITLNPKDEFTLSVYTNMYSILMTHFPDSEEVFKISLAFAENLIQKKAHVDQNLLQYILYVIKVSGLGDNLGKILYEFLQRNQNLISSNLGNTVLNMIQTEIIEEIILYEVVDIPDAKTVLNILLERYNETYNNFLSYSNFYKAENGTVMMESLPQSLQKNYDILISDLCEIKTKILGALISILCLYQNKRNCNLSSMFENLLLILIDEIKITKEVYDIKPTVITSSYITNLIHLFERITIYNYDLFNNKLLVYTQQKNISINQFFFMLFNLMAQSITIEVRKINLLFLCQMLPFLGFDFFTENAKTIHELCFNLAHKDFIKSKGEGMIVTHEDDNVILGIKQAKIVKIVTSPNGFINNLRGGIRAINISERKSRLIKEDPILVNFNGYTTFCSAIMNLCNKFGKNLQDAINLLAKKKDLEVFNEMFKSMNH
ncbi:MAG: hypothetical protein MJ252_05005 [archaeon]|nr:hypothetical protein [archaeon]